MEQRSGELLGADVRIEASIPVASIYRTKAAEIELAVSRQAEFPSVILDPQGIPKLVAVKVVEMGYPLRGRLRVSDQLFEEGTETDSVPEFGTLWVGAAKRRSCYRRPAAPATVCWSQVTENRWPHLLTGRVSEMTQVLGFEPSVTSSRKFAPRLIERRATSGLPALWLS